MSFLQDLRPYFKDRLAVADSDYTEHVNPFSEDDIPSTLLHKAYELKYGVFSVQGQILNGSAEFRGNVILDVFFKGYNDPLTGIDNALTASETIIQEVCRRSQANTQTNGCIRTILPRDVSFNQIGATNDSVIRLTIVFNCVLVMSVP